MVLPPPLPRRINIIEIHHHAQKLHIHIRLHRQIAQQHIKPSREVLCQLSQPLAQGRQHLILARGRRIQARDPATGVHGEGGVGAILVSCC